MEKFAACRWIGASDCNGPLFRVTFEVPEKLRTASLNISAAGLIEPYINGEKNYRPCP